MPDPGETLPISYFPAQETQLYKISTQQEAFRGGRGSITLMRYTDSPIGEDVSQHPLIEGIVTEREIAIPHRGF